MTDDVRSILTDRTRGDGRVHSIVACCSQCDAGIMRLDAKLARLAELESEQRDVSKLTSALHLIWNACRKSSTLSLQSMMVEPIIADALRVSAQPGGEREP